MATPAFQELLARRATEAFGVMASLLRGMSVAAARRLHMESNAAVPDQTRLKAATVIIESATKLTEFFTVIEKVEELKKALADQKSAAGAEKNGPSALLDRLRRIDQFEERSVPNGDNGRATHPH
jgi:hypothetical protein